MGGEPGSALRKLRTAARLLITRPTAIPSVFVQLERFVVFAIDPASLEPVEAQGMIVRPLQDNELRTLARYGEEWNEQERRFETLAFNAAFGVFRQEDLLHVAWLLKATHDSRQTERNLILRNTDAEITHCQTAERFRGQGAYPFAIRQICCHARGIGIDRILMITNRRNRPSQRGIVKAGLATVGSIWRVRIPVLPGEPSVVYRRYPT